ncbi:hypothetical protein JQS43_14270 [Natronosporangium hydrolyticum]|uniref:Uncharacterized protein n=1 Tax=Natronosporangium hydrolyticum TaxID=2811111 RepID=A0A895Y952_9ACTN|nr:hypothetical protein [Natronosporangium hydrolyticum]QSB12845.1 hypothetical protein JQS43_14270 [Natronosporangium hydrolyticum]
MDSPLQTWITGWLAFLELALPLAFAVVVLAHGCYRVVMRRGGWPWKTMVFGLGAALVFLLLTNVVSVADWFVEELPIN